jgi:diketogulonate reductase-like aldo/keto reductase
MIFMLWIQVAINWCICKGTIPISGVKTVRHVKENLGALGWRLSPAEISELESAAMAAPKKMIQNVFQTAWTYGGISTTNITDSTSRYEYQKEALCNSEFRTNAVVC